MSPDVFEGLDSKEDVELAKAAQRSLVTALARSGTVNIAILQNGVESLDGADIMELPPKALRLFADMLGILAQGSSMAIMPMEMYVSTQEAAMFLNVSRPHVIRMLDEGKLPCHKVGTRRRIKLEDVLIYKREQHKVSQAALQELVDQAQESGMGY